MKILAEGYKPFGGESFSGRHWWLLAPCDDWSDDELCDELGAVSTWRGAGRPYSDAGYVRRTRTRVLVTCSVGLDV